MISKPPVAPGDAEKTGQLDPENSFDDVLVRIKTSYRNPYVGRIQQAVLKDGPQTFKVATLLEIINPRSSETHHYDLKIDYINRRKNGWFNKPERSIRLSGEDSDEIEKLHRFISAHLADTLAADPGELHLIRSEDYQQLEELVSCLPNLPKSDKFGLIKEVLKGLLKNPPDLRDTIVTRSHKEAA